MASWRSMTKIAWSGSISQRHGSADPDPHQNVMDPQHWFPPISPIHVRLRHKMAYVRSVPAPAVISPVHGAAILIYYLVCLVLPRHGGRCAENCWGHPVCGEEGRSLKDTLSTSRFQGVPRYDTYSILQQGFCPFITYKKPLFRDRLSQMLRLQSHSKAWRLGMTFQRE